jgi:1-acyl-sn-glycerol-3-phosphate acyltransferase
MTLEVTAPENMPTGGNGFTRWLGRLILRLLGWKITGTIPNEVKLVVIGAPHTSNWDFILTISMIMALGMKMSFFMKQEAFFWPMKGLFMKLGGVPVNRGKASSVMKESIEWFKRSEKAWIAITPEGTRGRVNNWKSGFVRIAHGAGVPILIIGVKGQKKELVFERLVAATDQFKEQAEELRQYMNKNYQGIKLENQ